MTRNQFTFIAFVNGALMLILAAAMLVPAAVDMAYGNADWQVFLAASGMTGFVGAALMLTVGQPRGKLEPRTGYLLTVIAWITATISGALPLLLGSLEARLVDAIFESMSGLTTTGATVFSGLDLMPPGILLWRSLLQWIGGLGIVAMALLLLPLLRVGGMQLFRSESSDISEKNRHRVSQVIGMTLGAYSGLTILCALGLIAAGMPVFDAVNHAMTAVATGGLSTHDASVAYFDSLAVEVVLMIFMLAGSLPLIFYADIALRGRRAFASETQVPAFLLVWMAAVGLMTLWNWQANGWELGRALRLSAFNVTSILTDTGFATDDFSLWGSFAVGGFMVLYFIGGCAGSTAGAIKIFRWQILMGASRLQLRRMLSANRVLTLRYGGRPVDADMVASVRTFFFMYLMTFAVLSLAVMAFGLDPLSATSSVAQAMAAAGPGLGPLVGPSTTFGAVPDSVKWLLSLAMLVGRLELSTVYVLFLSDYWKR